MLLWLWEKIKEVGNHRRDAQQAGLPFESLISTYSRYVKDLQSGDSIRAWEAVERLSSQDW
jgi:hypothetical protein